MFLLPFLLVIVHWTPQLNSYQLQGGQRETVQLTAPADQVQGTPNEKLYTVQGGSQEESDNLQPAMGYETLSQAQKGIVL